MFNIVALEKKEYKGDKYPTAYYLHTQEYPHIIKIHKALYDMIKDNGMVQFDILPSMLKVSRVDGNIYYSFEKEEK